MDTPLAMRDLLGAAAVLSRVEVSTKKQLLLDMAQQAGALLGVDPHNVFDVLWEREKLGSTGVGHGIAIPHGRVEKLTCVQGVFARLSAPLAFDAHDERPVDLVFLLLAPCDAGADHLHALALVSKRLRDVEFCEKLRKAKDAAALYRLMTEAASAQAA